MNAVARDAQANAVERARLRGRRAAHAVVVGVAVTFVAASAWQIVGAVFGLGVAPAGVASANPADQACTRGLRMLSSALDRAGARAALAPARPDEPAAASDAFAAALAPDWTGAPAVAEACTQSRGGRDAWAALLRLRSAEEQTSRQSRAELGPLRRDLAAHLPPDLR